MRFDCPYERTSTIAKKWRKTREKRRLNHIILVVCKKRFQKTANIREQDFENWQKWQLGKGYSLYKMVSLGQKIKLLKTPESHNI